MISIKNIFQGVESRWNWSSKLSGLFKPIWAPVFIIAAVLAITLNILYAPFPFRVIGGWGTDHTSHWMSALAFSSSGFDIFKKPIEEVCPVKNGDRVQQFIFKYKIDHTGSVCLLNKKADDVVFFINWPNFPRFYPLGALLFSLPEALLYQWGYSFSFVNRVMAIQMILSATLLAWALVSISTSTSKQSTENGSSQSLPLRIGQNLLYIPLALFILEIFRWTLSGFYDSAGALLMVSAFYFSFTRRNYAYGLLFWALAFFVHYRAIWYFPFVLITLTLWSFQVFQISRETGQKINNLLLKTLSENYLALALAMTLTTLSLITFRMSYPWMLATPVTNPLYFSNANWSSQLAFLFFLSLAFNYSLFNKCWKSLLMLIGVTFFILKTPEVRPWHPIFLTPLFLTPYWERPKVRVGAGICMSLFIFVLMHSAFQFSLTQFCRFFKIPLI